MRRLLLLLFAVFSAVSIMSVSALGETSLTDLAQYVEDDALVFASIRTDDGYLGTLDSLYQRALPFLPSDALPPADSLVELLNFGLSSSELGTFEDDVRPWLGNSAALAFFTTDTFSTADLLFILEADGEAALEFFEPDFEEGMQNGFIERSEQDGFTIFLDAEFQTATAFGEDVIFVSVLQENDAVDDVFATVIAELEGEPIEEEEVELRDPLTLIPFAGVDNPLSESDTFNNALSDLPQDSYNIIIYSNFVEFQSTQIAALGLDQPEFAELFTNVGSTAFGFTVLNDDSLTIDIVQRADNSALEELGVMPIVPSALDYGFTNRIPEDAIAVVQTSDFGGTVQASFDNIRAISSYIQAQGGIATLVDPTNELLTDEERRILDELDIAWLLGAINISFSGGTGLSLENDVLPVLDGDAATYLRILRDDNAFLPIQLDSALLFQTSDPDGAAAIVEQLGVSASNFDIKISTEDYGDSSAIVLESDDVFSANDDNLDFLLGSSDEVVALGTRRAAENALSTDDGLADNAIFQEAQATFLPESQQLAYLAMDPVLDLLDELAESGDIFVDDFVEELYKALSILESSSVTSTVSEDGLTTIRLVITLSDEPRSIAD
ncbi:MAG: DUF3352 domain-containing protein [Chloroflexota bacterium]